MKTQIKVPEQLTRAAEVTITGDGEEKEFSMSVCSNEPYLRYDYWNDKEYWEVLDMKGVDETRLKAGLPLLFNHDRRQYLGVAKKYENDGKKITVKGIIWSDTPFAQEKKADAMKGALPFTSIGYRLADDGVCTGERDGKPVYNFKCEIFEGSIVTVPADPTVGVGRSEEELTQLRSLPGKVIAIDLQKGVDSETEKVQTQPNRKNSMAATPEEIEAEKQKIEVVRETARKEGQKAEQDRVSGIQERETHFRDKGLGGRKIDTSELAAQFIREGKSPREFQDAVVNGSFKEAKAVETAKVSEGMTERDISKYSLMRAINSVIGATQGKRFDGLEREMSDEVAKNHGRPASTLGFYIPHDVMARSHNVALTHQQRTLFATGSFTAAGALVPIGAQGQSLIDLYRNKMHVVAMGAQVLGGLQGTLAIPRQTGGATAAWLAEDATITASNQAVGQLTLTPHRLAAATAFSTQLLAQASPDIENFVRNDLMTVLAVEKDRAALLGTGSAGEPLGVYNTAGIAATVDITATASITYAEAVQFETNVAAGNADLGSLGYITSVFIRGTARVTPKFSSTATPLWDGDMLGSYPARATNQLTATPSVIFGNWADMIIGDWASPEIIVDPYSLSMANQIRIVVHQLTDVGIRHLKSFCFGVV
jgi:HK97 family phage major capsid protein/HK97 family phage prohead protease